MLHDELARMAHDRVVNEQGRSQRGAGVAGGGLDEDLVEFRLLQQPAVRQRVEGAAAGKGQFLQAGHPLERSHQGEEALLVHRLGRSGQVVVKLSQLLVLAARALTQQLYQGLVEDRPQIGLAVVPGHVHAFAHHPEVLLVQLESTVVQRGYQLGQFFGEGGFPIGGQSHHLVFVTVLGKPQVLGDRRVEQAQGMRVKDTVDHVNPVSAPNGPHGGNEVAEAVDGEAHRFLEGAAQEGRGDVGEVMFHPVEPGGALRIHGAGIRDHPVEGVDSGNGAQTVPGVGQQPRV